MDLKSHQEYNRYMEDVLSQIKNREAQSEIILELQHHIQDIAAEHLQAGLTEQEAIAKAISRMGDARAVGRELNRIHRPRLNWSVFGLALVLAAAGLFLAYFIDVDTGLLSRSAQFPTRAIITSLGIALAVCLYFFDYRKLQTYSLHIYIGMVLVLVFITLQRGNWLYTVRINNNFIATSPLFLGISLAGLFSNWPWGKLKYYALALVMLSVPLMMILLYPSNATGLAFAAVFFVIMYVSGAKPWQVLLPVLASGGAFLLSLSVKTPYHHHLYKISGWLNPGSDPNGVGWLYLLLGRLRQSAELVGRGSLPQPIPFPLHEGELLLSYIIYNFGWLAVLAISVAIAALLLRLAKVGMSTRNVFGKSLAAGITAFLGVKCLWNILMNLGILPIAGFTLPLISHGNTDFLLNMVLIGLALSIYRRRTLTGLPSNVVES